MVAFLIPDLPRCSAFELAAAVRRTIEDGPAGAGATTIDGKLPASEELPSTETLHRAAAGAREGTSFTPDPDNARALAWLEASYIVAASDGLEPQERQAVSALIARLVGSAPPEAVCDVLAWFDERLATDGVEARMAHIASHFDSRGEREQVLGFATLLALADRRMALKEQNVLLRLGEVLGFKPVEVQMLVHKISLRLEKAMAASHAPTVPPVISTPPVDDLARERRETVPAGSRRGDGDPPTERSS